jgi:hypothetical protein
MLRWRGAGGTEIGPAGLTDVRSKPMILSIKLKNLQIQKSALTCRFQVGNMATVSSCCQPGCP